MLPFYKQVVELSRFQTFITFSVQPKLLAMKMCLIYFYKFCFFYLLVMSLQGQFSFYHLSYTSRIVHILTIDRFHTFFNKHFSDERIRKIFQNKCINHRIWNYTSESSNIFVLNMLKMEVHFCFPRLIHDNELMTIIIKKRMSN